jgi:hypothetical protein
MHAESAMLCASTALPGCMLRALGATALSEVDGAPRGVNEKISKPVAFRSSFEALK